MHIAHLIPASYRRSPWKNGGGVTVDIAEERLSGSAPGSWEGLVWRLGRTTISTPAPFSDLAGFDRCQVVVAGSGLVLDTPHGEIDLRQMFVPQRYPGEAPISSRLENGPVEVVNLIGDRKRVAIRLDVLREGTKLDLPEGVCVLYAASGPADLELNGARHRLAENHGLQLTAATLQVNCGQGVVLAASISRR